ncbi:IDEAL domain-containing protein [Lentibacillus sp. N15]|uniref:IDEAL domain-containing protein n=1 Tax=Lentibacillus songyuanensis TaxID=3136161 RepID=UPI0031BB806D
MVTVKELKPYHIKVDSDYVHIILAYQYFTISIDESVYKFVPVDAKEITINRKTKKIKNMEDMFAFQKGKEIIHIAMADLTFIPEFLIQLHSIAGPYYLVDLQAAEDNKFNISAIMDELEQQNIKRLIDRSLDERDEESFYKLVHRL